MEASKHKEEDVAKTRLGVRPAYSVDYEVKTGVCQGPVLSPLLLAIVVDVIKKMKDRMRSMKYYMQMILFSYVKP